MLVSFSISKTKYCQSVCFSDCSFILPFQRERIENNHPSGNNSISVRKFSKNCSVWEQLGAMVHTWNPCPWSCDSRLLLASVCLLFLWMSNSTSLMQLTQTFSFSILASNWLLRLQIIKFISLTLSTLPYRLLANILGFNSKIDSEFIYFTTTT